MLKPKESPEGIPSWISRINEDVLPELEDLEADFPDDELQPYVNQIEYEECSANTEP